MVAVPESQARQALRDGIGADDRSSHERVGRRRMHSRRTVTGCLVAALLALEGCSTEPTQLLHASASASICQQRNERLVALVLWSSSWDGSIDNTFARTAVGQGIEDAFRTSTGCFLVANIWPSQSEFERPLAEVSESEARNFANSVMTPCHRILSIVVTEGLPRPRPGELLAYVLGRPRILVEVRLLRLPVANELSTATWESRGTYMFHGVDNLATSISTVVSLSLSSSEATQ